MAQAAETLKDFADTGYLGPVPVLSRSDCRRFLRAVDRRPPTALDWEKGVAATSRAYYEIAVRPEILDVVADLLGDEVILWGASVVNRAPDEAHAWHSDIESSDPDGRTVSVWVGLQHTTPDSTLLILPHSHLFGVTVQQVRQENGTARNETSLDDLLHWARERDGRSELVNTGVTDGEALFFDGRLWHGTHNVSRSTRRALLLQYAVPDTIIRMPDSNNLDWPFRRLDSPRPPCLIVRGSAKTGPNRVVPAPVGDARTLRGTQLTSRIHPVRLPLAPGEQRGWKPFGAFRGLTANLPSISCHVSVLPQDVTPHPPHGHAEEQLILLLAGEVELIFADNERAALREGELVYYPANFAHTLQTTSAEAAAYVIFKWRGEQVGSDSPLPYGHFDTTGNPRTRLLFEGPTRYLRKLHSHVTALEPGDGYEPHVDAYDVAIVVLEGELETIGGRAVPHDVIFFVAGEAHGMHNVGGTVARYVVFEFHGRTSLAIRAPSAAGVLLAKVRDPRRLKRKLRKLLTR